MPKKTKKPNNSANKENIDENPSKKKKSNRFAHLLQYEPGSTPIARRLRSREKNNTGKI